jgi:hypothetical protein
VSELVAGLGMLALMMVVQILLFAVLGLGVAAAVVAPLALVSQARHKASDEALAACRRALGAADDARVERDGVAWTLHGVVGPQGQPVRVDFRRNATTDGFAETLWIRIELVGGLPAGTMLEAGSGGSALGDPILDGRIELSSSSARSSERVAGLRFLHARLQDPRHDLRGCLMDVLVGLPRSRVQDGGVEIEVQHDAHPLPELLERLGALAAALSDPPDPAPASDAQPDATPESERSAALRAEAGAGRQKA